MNTPVSWFEEAICALERKLGGVVTIVDHQGVFQSAPGRVIFPGARQSHRKIPACHFGFSEHCVETCRYAMNARGETESGAFVKRCWKGLVEIAVPLRRDGQHLGMLYYGIWREGKRSRCREARDEIAQLAVWEEGFFPELAPLLEAFAAGLMARLEPFSTAPDFRARVRLLLAKHGSEAGFSLETLAEKLHLSPSHVGRLVRQNFEMGFTQLLHEARIARAKALLLSTDERLAAVAVAVGFRDEYHFSKVFRKRVGMTPGSFRKEQRSFEPSLPGGR